MRWGAGALAGRQGIGHRHELAGDLLTQPPSVGFLETVAESCFADQASRREIVALSERWPVVPHGVKLSLASADGIDSDKAARLGALARELGAPLVSEHVAVTTVGGRELGHLMPAPRCEALIRVVAKNVSRARRSQPDVPLLLENIAAPFGFAEDAMPEAELYGRIVEATGCDLLLDVANLYANAVNCGSDPVAIARAFPLERVGMVHLAGGILEDAFYFDTHAHPVPDAVFEVLSVVLQAVHDVPILLERDSHFDDGIGPLLSELDRAAALRPAGAAARQAVGAATARELGEIASGEASAFASDQAALAALLLDEASPAGALVDSIGRIEIDRARRILGRKRVEDALPLLPRLARQARAVWPIAERALAAAGRAQRMQAVADALAIAEAVVEVETPALADEARRDRLPLLTRFAMDHGAPAPRRGPFVARERLSTNTVLWAVKGFGAGAPIRIHERGSRREQRAT